MKLRLLDVIVQPEQYPQNQTAPHKETHICFIKNIKQISQYTDKSKSTVCTEKRGFSFSFQTDSTLRQTDKKRK